MAENFALLDITPDQVAPQRDGRAYCHEGRHTVQVATIHRLVLSERWFMSGTGPYKCFSHNACCDGCWERMTHG